MPNPTPIEYFSPISVSIAPTSDNHLTNKAYVDGKVSAIPGPDLVTLSTGSIPLTKHGQAFLRAVSGSETLTLNTSGLNAGPTECVSFTLFLSVASGTPTVTWPTGWIWAGGSPPELAAGINKIEVQRAGGLWLARSAGLYQLPWITGVTVASNSPVTFVDEINPETMEPYTYPANQLVSVTGTQPGDTVAYEIEGITPSGGGIPEATEPGIYTVTVTVQRAGHQDLVSTQTVALKKDSYVSEFTCVAEDKGDGRVSIYYHAFPSDAEGEWYAIINGTEYTTDLFGHEIEVENLPDGTYQVTCGTRSTNYLDVTGTCSVVVQGGGGGGYIIPFDSGNVTVSCEFDGDTYTGVLESDDGE